MLTLYYAPNTVALASLIILEELRQPYQSERIDFNSGQQRSESFLKINPKGRVPILVTPEGNLSETPAILTYLADHAPEAGLLPEGAFARAQVQSALSYLASTVHVAHAHGPRGHRWADDPVAIAAMKAKVPETMAASFAHIEADLLVGPWVLGAQFTIADAHLYAISRWLANDGVDIAQFQKVAAHFAAVSARPAVQRALARQDA